MLIVDALHHFNVEDGTREILDRARQEYPNHKIPADVDPDWLEVELNRVGLEILFAYEGDTAVVWGDDYELGYACPQCAYLVDGYSPAELGLDSMPDIELDGWTCLGVSVDYAVCSLCDNNANFGANIIVRETN